MAKIKAKAVADTAYKAACGAFGPSTYRRDNTGTNYGADYNVGKWYNGHWCSDCLGFVHIMVNGFTGDKSKLGGGAVMDDFVWNSDEARTLNAFCSVKGKFPKADAKPATLLQSSGHVGLYIGTAFNGEYNTAECTTAKGGGWVLTWTDMNNGARYSKRTGGYYISSWENWGEFDRVDYKEEPEVSPWKDIKPTDPIYDCYKAVHEAGLMNGYSDGKFKPKAKVTRRQMVIILYRILKLLKK